MDMRVAWNAEKQCIVACVKRGMTAARFRRSFVDASFARVTARATLAALRELGCNCPPLSQRCIMYCTLIYA